MPEAFHFGSSCGHMINSRDFSVLATCCSQIVCGLKPTYEIMQIIWAFFEFFNLFISLLLLEVGLQLVS